MSEVLYPHGYRRWACDWCSASCNFEAMNWCHMTSGGIACPFDRDQPESLDGAFEFMVKEGEPMAESEKDGIKVETKYHAPDGTCMYTITLSAWALDNDKTWYDDCFGKISEHLKPFNLEPSNTHWNSYQHAPTNSWIIGGRAKPINHTHRDRSYNPDTCDGAKITK